MPKEFECHIPGECDTTGENTCCMLCEHWEDCEHPYICFEACDKFKEYKEKEKLVRSKAHHVNG